MKFHHIGIFVESLKKGVTEISSIIEVSEVGNPIKDELLSVQIQFVVDNDGITYEIVAPFGNNSPVTEVLSRGYGHLNHIAYTSDSFESELARLRTEGMVPLGQPRKAKAFNGSRVVFFLTKLGFIIEVIEAS